MTFAPRTVEEIYTSLRDDLTGKILGLTNFTETSFNYLWTRAFSEDFRELEIHALEAQLSGWVDYAGGPINEDDLEELGLGGVVDPEDLDQDDEYLDRLVRIVGVERDPGSPATGQVTFTTQSAATTVPAGTRVATQPDANGDFYEFTTDAEVSNASGETTLVADITAEDVGDEYNVGAGTITYLPAPPTGVQSVSNNNATSAGEDRETNDELRERAKRAIFENSGGGTVDGVIGYIESEVEGVDEAEIIEFYEGDTWHGNYPHAHVIVSGGNEQDVIDAIEQSRPVAVQHVLVRPDILQVRIDANLEGADIDTGGIESILRGYLNNLDLNEEVVDVQVIKRIMNGDTDVYDIPMLNFYIESEQIYYDSAKNVYNLFHGGLMDADGIVEVTGTLNGSEHTFVEDTDYQELDDDGDGSVDSIDWSLSGDTPDVTTGLTDTITYESGTAQYIVDDAMITNGITQVTGTVNGSSTTFTEGTDFEEVDVRGDGQINGIDWSIGGSSPDDGTDFTVTYDAGTPFYVTYRLDGSPDIPFDKTSKGTAGSINLTVV